MRSAKIFFKSEEAGVLTQHNDASFTFVYHDAWFIDDSKPSISLTLPKKVKEFHSKNLFSFFFNMLPEGPNKLIVCKLNRIDSDDYFGLLMITAKNDTIGAIRVAKNF
jgi:HipA-like protein